MSQFCEERSVLHFVELTCCYFCRYACYYLTRNSLTYTAPVMTADPALKMDITQVGTMTSIFPIAYGFSKFLSGVLGARTSPRVMLAGGLMATAIVNILFGFGHSMVWFCSFWALNGVLQVMAVLPTLLIPGNIGLAGMPRGS